MNRIAFEKMLEVAYHEAELGRKEGGIPIGAALYDSEGNLLGSGRNRRIQDDDPAMHAETNAFHNAGRQKCYTDKIMVTTLSPCWFCCGMIKQFKIGTVVIGDNTLFQVGEEWLEESGVEVIVMNSEKCKKILEEFIEMKPEIWNEDIGEC